MASCTTTSDPLTMTFETNSDSQLSPIIETKDATVLLPIPQKDNFVFVGWYVNEELTIPFLTTAMPDESIILYAKWAESSTNVWTFRVIQNQENQITIEILITGDVEFIGYDARIIYDSTALEIKSINNLFQNTINENTNGIIIFNYVNALQLTNQESIILEIEFEKQGEFNYNDISIEVVDMISITESYDIFSIDYSIITL